MKIDAQGTIRVYDPATNEFGAYTAGGLTKAFKPTSPTYWSRQVGIAPVILGQTSTQGRG
jgi:pyocin large subunit-like protein